MALLIARASLLLSTACAVLAYSTVSAQETTRNPHGDSATRQCGGLDGYDQIFTGLSFRF